MVAAAAEHAGLDQASDDMTPSLRLVWPGYFADQANVLPFPPDLYERPGCVASALTRTRALAGLG